MIVVDELTLEAMAMFIETGCVPIEYYNRVCGDQRVGISPFVRKIRVYTLAELAQRDCPLPPEPDWN